MGAVIEQFDRAFRDFNTDGIAASGLAEVDKAEARAIGPIIEQAVAQVGLGALISARFATLAAANASLAYPDGAVAIVYADATATNNDLIVKAGASGTGAWAVSGILASMIGALTGAAVANSAASATLAGHYANDAADSDVPGGPAGSRGARYWAEAAAANISGFTADLAGVRSTVFGSAGARAVLGRPTSAALVTGSAVGAATYVYADPIAAAGFLEYVDLYNPASTASTVRIRRFAKSGNDFSQVGTDLVLTVQPGNNHITFATFGIWSYNAGERLGINAYTSSAGRLAYISGAGDSSGYYDSGSGGDTGTFTDAATNTAVQLQLRFGLITSLPVTGLVDQFATLSGSVSANALAIASIQAMIGGAAGGTTWVIGRPAGSSLVTGTALGGAVYVYATAMAQAGFLQQIDLYNPNGSGTVTIRRYTKSGNDFTQVGTDLVVPVAAGLNSISYTTFGSWPFNAGDYLGIYPRSGSTGLVAYLAGTTGDSGGYYDSGGAGNVAAFTDAGATTNAQFQLRFTLTTSLPSAGAIADIASLKTRVTALEGGAGSNFAGVQPIGYILIWGLGQSNMAGRAPTLSSFSFEAGQAYKYVRATTSLATMADPTGNDATAAAGKGSIGPALAKRIQQLSNGKIGVIFVNSAEGGTRVETNWASGGAVWNQALTDLANAKAAALAANLPIIGCCSLAQLGESNADDGMAGATFKTAWLDWKSRIDAAVGAKVPMLINRIGTLSSGDTSGYATIRQALDELAEDNAGIYMAHTGAKSFSSRGLMTDSYHYVIAAYDEIGTLDAPTVLALALGQRPKGYHG